VNLRNPSVFVNQIRDPARVFVGRAVTCTVGETELAIGVAEQRKIESILLRELGAVFTLVEADADDLYVLLVVFGLEVPEPGTFCGSARGVSLREEPEDDLFPLHVLQADRLSGVIFGVEVRSGITGL
jgi:hypothetical protein